MVLAIVLAFLMTLITAASNIILKKAFSKIEPFVGLYISVLISTVFLWVATFLLVPKYHFQNHRGIMIFIAIGCFAPTIVRGLTYLGIDKLGAGRAAPLRAMTPFFATVIAIFFLKESPRFTIFLGIISIVFGVSLIAQRERRDLFPPKPVHFFYPLIAAFLAGIIANVRKFGLFIMPQPIFASSLAATSSLVILTIYILLKRNKIQFKKILLMKEFRWIIAASFLTSCGEIVDLSALLLGKVSLVIPIFATTPLLIIILSRIFLKKQEVITPKIVVSALLIILGVYIVIKSVG